MSLENSNPELDAVVGSETTLKEILVNYVGQEANPDNDEVTVKMIVETIATEFPEFLSVVAEENWIRGYHQALVDVETGQKAHQDFLNDNSEIDDAEKRNTTVD